MVARRTWFFRLNGVKCEDNRVISVHDRTGKPVGIKHTHTVQEFDSPGHHVTASSNVNKFNLAIDEELQHLRHAKFDEETITQN